ncbi:FAD-dependent oxidoreductase [Curtobacterium sp. BRB10]|uniref:NAD(P)/FAD-dependent oxidoreductase n=1 Tax=Curtobacterium sp. BRB10 TaxID=2962579 RepID=UPI002880C5D3|nr:FAD-dependent oxidoreductase [Curtobacterium sp. BRB10]MDT0234835.1 FAD-dependent oxidoreductase [Curtobacterium sp. BRB10]
MATPTRSDVVIVGASVAGLAVVDGLRRGGFAGTITVIDADDDPNHDRPPLSKAYLQGTIDRAGLRLRTPEALDAAEATWIRGDAAVAYDPVTRCVTTAAGRSVSGGDVVIATGVSPRRLPSSDGTAGLVLRSVSDADRLAAELRTPLADAGQRHVAVIGNGVLGSEIAATVSGTGAAVTLAGRAPAPMAHLLGPTGSGILAAVHSEHGVRLTTTGRALSIRSVGAAQVVDFDDGAHVRADTVVLAIGSEPSTGWLDGSGLPVDDGLVSDEFGRVVDGTWAAGDVARPFQPALGRHRRLENRTNALKHGTAVARNILGADLPYTPTPYFWTDQFGARVQVWGAMGEDTPEIVEGSVEDRRFVAVARAAGGEPVGVLGWRMPKQGRLHAVSIAAAQPAGPVHV